MAKNWTVAEAAVEIKKGNKEAILDIGKRYPLFLNLVAGALAGDTEKTLELLVSLPEYNTANKINGRLKEGVEITASEDDGDEEVTPKETAKTSEKKDSKAKAKDAESDGEDYESMGAYPLYQLCKERGLEVKSKRPKEEYIAALVAADGEGSDDDDDSDDGESGSEYEGKSAQDLFKLCKSRKISVEPKKKAEYYIEKLEAADAEESGDGEDNDDWDEEPVKETKKEEKKATGKAGAKKEDKKPAKKEEDDEWDI